MANLVTSGIPALDTFMQGGFPEGFTILLVAPTGSGAEVFAKQFAANHAKERVTYVTTDEPEREVYEAVSASGWSFDSVEIMDLQSHFVDAVLAAKSASKRQDEVDTGKRRRLKVNARSLVEDTSSEDLLERNPRRRARQQAAAVTASKENYLDMLLEPYTSLQQPNRMIVDTLDFFLNMYSEEEVITTLHALKAANSKARGLMLWVLAKGAHDTTTERRLELMADCLIEMEVTRRGTTFERFFMVKKVKNRRQGVGVSTYEVTEDGFELETLERIV